MSGICMTRSVPRQKSGFVLPRHLLACLLALLLAPFGATLAAESPCRIEPFRGATLPKGTVAHVRVVNSGKACLIANHGVPEDRSHPADSGKITKEPAHGNAEFIAPHASYTPAPGYVGEDEFAYEAFAQGKINQRVRLKVTVKVEVVAQ